MISLKTLSVTLLFAVIALVSGFYITSNSNENNLLSVNDRPLFEKTTASSETVLKPATLGRTFDDANSIGNSGATESDIDVVYRNRKLSVDLVKQPLLSVIEKIGLLASIRISGDSSLERYSVSVSFSDMPIEEGIRRIAHPLQTLFLYGADGSRNTLEQVWIFKESPQQSVDSHIQDAILSARLSENAGQAANNSQSSLLTERDVIESLVSGEETARGKALLSVLNGEVKVETNYLKEVFHNLSESPVLRAMALDALASNEQFSRDEFLILIDEALQDSSQTLRDQAKAYLYHFELAQNVTSTEDQNGDF